MTSPTNPNNSDPSRNLPSNPSVPGSETFDPLTIPQRLAAAIAANPGPDDDNGLAAALSAPYDYTPSIDDASITNLLANPAPYRPTLEFSAENLPQILADRIAAVDLASERAEELAQPRPQDRLFIHPNAPIQVEAGSENESEAEGSEDAEAQAVIRRQRKRDRLRGIFRKAMKVIHSSRQEGGGAA